MKATPDRPSVTDLERLEHALQEQPVSPADLTSALRRIEEALLQHERDVDRAGGLINQRERVARPSLDRFEHHLRERTDALAAQTSELRGELERGGNVASVLPRVRTLYEALLKLRNAEAEVTYEGVETDIGAGD